MRGEEKCKEIETNDAENDQRSMTRRSQRAPSREKVPTLLYFGPHSWEGWGTGGWDFTLGYLRHRDIIPNMLRDVPH